MIDHFAYDSVEGAEDHAAVLADGYVRSAAVLPPSVSGPVLFRGVGLTVAPESETVRAAGVAAQRLCAGCWSLLEGQ